ncbi:MAG: ATP-binding protein [Gammaproteobacteria bacterium]|nr:ATP-binding protein [Gammaproteobacteria bacterium]
MDVTRTDALRRLRLLLREYPIVALLGARQVGKTTLARQLAAKRTATTWFDLEDPADLARLDDPALELRPLKGLVVLDEIHRLPEVFPLLRVLADRPGTPARFLVLGSASPELLRQTSETLAGRVAFCRLDGFNTKEVGDIDRLWLRGGFPRSYLARSEAASVRWRHNFVDTFLSRDVPNLSGSVPPATLRRFWTMLAHWHGQTWNGAEFGRAFGVAHTTVRRYLDLMTSLFMVRQLAPWFENISKRQVRSPKVYVADAGILHSLLGLRSRDALVSHPKVGASWEGFVVTQVIERLAARPEQCFHWSTHSGAELDLLIVAGPHRLGFEVKRAEAPTLTRSMRSSFETLKLDSLDVIHAGTQRYQLAEGIRALPATEINTAFHPLGK